MWTDEIVEETRREREAYAARFNYDLEAIYHDLKAKEQQSGREVVLLSPRRPLQIPKRRAVKTVGA